MHKHRLTRREIWETIRTIVVFYLVLITGSVLLYVAEMNEPSLLPLLSLARATPWGIITSIFAHKSLEHLLLNMINIVISSFLLLGLLLFNGEGNPKRTSLFFCLCPFISGIITNVLFLSLAPQSKSLGASGVLFAIVGVLLMASLMGIFRKMRAVTIKTYFSRHLLHFSYHIFIFLFYFLQTIFIPTIFLNVSQGVNVFVHAISFLLAVGSTLLYYLISHQ